MSPAIALQPIIDIAHSCPGAHEVLARIPNGVSGWLGPQQAVHRGCWAALDRNVMERIEALCQNPPLGLLFVNVSTETLQDESAFSDWCCHITRIVSTGKASMAPRKLVIEVSETTPESVLSDRWEALRQLGVGLAIDDFGTGYSNVTRLTRYQWEFCKFESHRLGQGLDRQAVEFCHDNGITPISEKVENQGEADKAQQLGIRFQQGYFHGMPQLESSVPAATCNDRLVAL